MDDAHHRGLGETVHEVRLAPRPGVTRYAPALTLAVFLLPIAAGLVGTLLPAFGYLPAIGGHDLNFESWRRLFAYPGFATSLLVTLTTGILTSILAVLLALGFCAFAHGFGWMRRIGEWLAPILATPHSAIAIGLAFLLAPSGWIVRVLSPWLTGWTLPPDVATVGDAAGLALVLGLLLKEVPYLILMIVGALHQVPVQQHLAIARSLGYGRPEAWIKTILPQIYPQIRLPVYAVIAFSLSVVDVALILGPSNPPTLAVLALRWFTDADIQFYFPAAAAATLLLLVVVAVVSAWFGVERVAAAVGRRWIARGGRASGVAFGAGVAATAFAIVFALAVFALAGMALWSFAEQWRFPDALPQAWSLANWMRRFQGLAVPLWHTLLLGVLATAIALTLVAGVPRERKPRPAPRGIGRAVAAVRAPARPAGRVPLRRAGAAGAREFRRHAGRRGLGASHFRAALSVPVAGRPVASVRSALRAHRGKPGRVGGARVFHRQASHSAATRAHRLRRRLRGERRAVPRNAFRRQRPRRHAHHRGGDLGRRCRPARDRRVCNGAGAVSLACLRCRGGVAGAAVRQPARHGAGTMNRAHFAPLRLDAVRIEIGGVTLIPPLTLEVAPGECATVMGPSGCGKSTLLAFVSGAIDPAFEVAGRVLIGSSDITRMAPEMRRVGIQFQDDLLFPHLSVGENLAFALRPHVRSRVERRERIDQALAEADLAGFAARDPATLSGGQRARVALMRTLLSEPNVLLLDEPFNKLDAQLRSDFRRFVFEHAAGRGLPTLLVTHDATDAQAAGGQVIELVGN